MSCSVDAGVCQAALTFVRRGGRTVLAHSRVAAPMALIRPFPLADGRQLVPLITLGPGLCGGDRIDLRIAVEAGADVVITTTAATRVLSMRPGRHAEQHVHVTVAAGATMQYYPLVTIPFPDSAFAQTVTVEADATARVGVLETWALGRTARDEYLAFRSLSSLTRLRVGGVCTYADATRLRPEDGRLDGVGVLAGRRYLASGFWHGATLAEERRDGAGAGDVLIAFAQSRPGLAYLRALSNDAPSLETALRTATARIAASWDQAPLALDRVRC